MREREEGVGRRKSWFHHLILEDSGPLSVRRKTLVERLLLEQSIFDNILEAVIFFLFLWLFVAMVAIARPTQLLWQIRSTLEHR